MSGYIIDRENQEIVVNIPNVEQLSTTSVIFAGGLSLSDLENEEVNDILELVEAYSPGPGPGPGPTPPTPPIPDEPIILQYADGWFEHQIGNWVLVKAGQTFNVDYRMTSTDLRRNKQYTAGDEDTWFNMDNEEWINAYGIDCGNTYNTNSVIAAKLTLPNCQVKSYTGNGLFYNAKELICVDITTKSYIGNFFSNSKLNNAIITIKENASSINSLFYNCNALVEVVLDVNSPQASLNQMFMGCNVLSKIIGIEDLDVSNVTDMNSMFYNCYSLQSLDLSNWNTSNVTIMQNMFNSCYSLQLIKGIENWNTSNATTFTAMFRDCYSLQSLDLSNWGVSNANNMQRMFYNCNSLQSLNLSNWNTSNVTTFNSMFYECNSLQSLDLSNWNVSNVTNMYCMFYDCYSLQSFDSSNWNTSNVTDIQQMFYGCFSLQLIKGIENWNVSNVTSARSLFYNCNALRSLDLSNWDVSNISTFVLNPGKLIYLKLTNKPKTVALSLASNPTPLSNYSLKWLADNFIDISGDSSYTNTTITLGTNDKNQSMYQYFYDTMTAKGYTIS